MNTKLWRLLDWNPHFEVFLAIVDAPNVTKISVLCNTTQPNLTRQLTALEPELGKSLFVRGRHSCLDRDRKAPAKSHKGNLSAL